MGQEPSCPLKDDPTPMTKHMSLDLITGEAIDPLSLDRPFAGSYCVADADESKTHLFLNPFFMYI